MLYVRGNRRDYDNWAKLGNTGWCYDKVLPYFKKSEDNRNPFLKDSSYHGTGGLLTVQEPAFHSPLAAAFVAGGVEMGYEHLDCNGEVQTGFIVSRATVRNGVRCSTAKAFLRVRLKVFKTWALNFTRNLSPAARTSLCGRILIGSASFVSTRRLFTTRPERVKRDHLMIQLP